MDDSFLKFLNDRLDQVEHTSTVDEFHKHFECIRSSVSFAQPWLSEAYFASRFVYGLQEEFQKFVLRFHPITVIAAYRLASIYKESIYQYYFPEPECHLVEDNCEVSSEIVETEADATAVFDDGFIDDNVPVDNSMLDSTLVIPCVDNVSEVMIKNANILRQKTIRSTKSLEGAEGYYQQVDVLLSCPITTGPFKIEAISRKLLSDTIEEFPVVKECLELQIEHSSCSWSYLLRFEIVRVLRYLISVDDILYRPASSVVLTMQKDTTIVVPDVAYFSWEPGPALVLASAVHVTVKSICSSGISTYRVDTSSARTLRDARTSVDRNSRGVETYFRCLPHMSKPTRVTVDDILPDRGYHDKLYQDGSSPNHLLELSMRKSLASMIVSAIDSRNDLDTNWVYDFSEQFSYCVIYVWSFDPGITQRFFGVHGICSLDHPIVPPIRFGQLAFRHQSIQDDDNNAWLLSEATLIPSVSGCYIRETRTSLFIWEPGPLTLQGRLYNLWQHTSLQYGLLFLTSKVPDVVKSSHILGIAAISIYAHEQDNTNIYGETGGTLTLQALQPHNYGLGSIAESIFSCVSECIPEQMILMPFRNVVKLSISAVSDETMLQAFSRFFTVTAHYSFLDFADPLISHSILKALIYYFSCYELNVWTAGQRLWQHTTGIVSCIQWQIAWYINIGFPARSRYDSVYIQNEFGLYHTGKKEIAEVNRLAIRIGIARGIGHALQLSILCTRLCLKEVFLFVQLALYVSVFTRISIQLRLHMVRTMAVPVTFQLMLFSWNSLFRGSTLMWVSKMEISYGVFLVFSSVHKEHIYIRLIVKKIHGAVDDLFQKNLFKGMHFFWNWD